MDPNQQQQAGASGQQEDYLDKGASITPTLLSHTQTLPC